MNTTGEKRILSFIGVLALMICLCVPAFADFDVNAARKGVAVVYTCLEYANGEELGGFGSGTCFFVGKSGENPIYLITNHHCIEDWIEYGEGQLVEHSTSNGPVALRSKIRVYYDATNYVEAYHVTSDSIKDIAILKLDTPTSERVSMPIRIPAEDMVATPVHAVGYPGLADNELVSPTTKWGMSDSSVDSGHISRLVNTAGTGVSIVQLDFTIRHGNSGGPLVNDLGQVVGITSMGISNSVTQESVDYAINIQEAVSMLNRENIAFDLIEESAPAPKPSVSDPKPFPVVPVILGVAAVVVIAVIVALILRPKPPVPVQPSKRPAVLSMSPQHNGMMLSLENRQIVAGRQGCDLAFRDGTPGVSGRHCSVYWDSNSKDFVVTDLQSSFGTYLQNGQRLTPNAGTHLKPGDSFYLGEPSNMLRVDMV